MSSSIPGPQPTPLTREALRQHGELMQRDVRRFCCPDCDLSWWRVVPANKPVSRCENCHLRFDPLPRWCEFGVGFFTCPNTDCQNVFYTDCMGDAHRECPNCFSIVGGPYIHPRIEPKQCYGQRVSKYHTSTGSTYDTWLSQPSSLAGDPFSSRGDLLPQPSPPLSPPHTRTSLSSPFLRHPGHSSQPSSLAGYRLFSRGDLLPQPHPLPPLQTRTTLISEPSSPNLLSLPYSRKKNYSLNSPRRQNILKFMAKVRSRLPGMRRRASSYSERFTRYRASSSCGSVGRGSGHSSIGSSCLAR